MNKDDIDIFLFMFTVILFSFVAAALVFMKTINLVGFNSIGCIICSVILFIVSFILSIPGLYTIWSIYTYNDEPKNNKNKQDK